MFDFFEHRLNSNMSPVMLYNKIERNKFLFSSLLLLFLFSIQLYAGSPRPLPAIALSINSTGTTCGRSNGSIIVTASGGTAPYRYQLNSNPVQSSNVFIYLAAGNYIITVTDAIGQIATANVVLTNMFTPPTGVIAQVTAISGGCTSNTAALTLTGVGGTPPYLYSINHTDF